MAKEHFAIMPLEVSKLIHHPRVKGLSDVKFRAYINLIGELWLNDGLEYDEAILQGAAQVSRRKLRVIEEFIPSFFQLGEDGKVRDKYMELKRKKVSESVAAKRKGAEEANRRIAEKRNAERTQSDTQSERYKIKENEIKYIDDDKATAPYSPTPQNIDWLGELEKSESAIESCQMKLHYLNCTKDEAFKLKSIFIAARRSEPDGNKQDAARHFNNWIGVAGKIELENIRSGKKNTIKQTEENQLANYAKQFGEK